MEYSYYKNGKLVVTSHPIDFEIKQTTENNRTRVVAKATEDVTLKSVKEVFFMDFVENQEMFFNGYQSWTDSKEIKIDAKEKNIYRSPKRIVQVYGMDKFGDAPFYNYEKYLLHGYDVCYSKGQNGFFLFSLNYQNGYLIFEYNKRTKKLTLISELNGIEVKKGQEIVLFDYVYAYSYEQGVVLFNNYFPKKNLPKLFGYTSWYNYYQNINESIILNDLKAIDNRFNLFQIDDGYETYVGDWMDVDANKFPHGLKPIVEEVHKKGLKAGLWLAPFVVEKKAKIFTEKPDWIKKDENGQQLFACGNWSGAYVLDLENPEVIDYIRKCLEHYVKMGFDFFKLDFLYAAGIEIPKGYSRCQYQYKCYKILRDVLKDKIILGCGANIINSYGLFDYLRIGPDVSLIFDDVAYMRFFHRERISTKTTLQNTIYRSLFNDRLFGNDPDVFLLRADNIQLSEEQKYSLAMINSLFSGVLMTSDDIAKYDEKKQKLLNQVLDNFLHAENVGFSKKMNHFIEIHYDLNGKHHTILYNYKSGVSLNG